MNFARLTTFVADVVSNFNIGPTATQVGVVQFSDSAFDEVVLGSINDKTQLITEITGIQYMGRGTNTHLGIQYARNQITNNGRSDFGKVLVVATDGRSNSPSLTLEEARITKETGTIIIAIGIGDSVDLNELTSIATSSKYVILIDEFSADAFSSILQLLTDQICLREWF